MNILITGVGGYIGSYLFHNLKYNNIYGTYNNLLPNYNKNKKNLFKVDLTKKIKLNSLINFDLVIHCASRTPFHKETMTNYKKNILITKNVIDFAKLNNVKKIFFLSTNSIYENIDSKKISEEKKSTKIGLYAKSKIKSEKLFISWAKESFADIIILRLPGVIGPGSENSFISKIAKAIKNNHVISINNVEAEFNNVINIESLNNVIKKIILLRLKTNIFNISSNKPIRIIEIVKLFEKKYRRKIKYINKKLKTKKFIINSLKIQKKGVNLPNVSDVIKKYIKLNINLKCPR